MAQLIDTTRIGNEPVLRITSDGTSVISLSLPCEYGRKGQDNKKPVQWVDGSLWGKQAEALAPYLLKGQTVAFTLDDVHTEEYQSQGATRTKMVGRISHIKLVGSRPEGSAPQPQAPQRSAPQRQPAPVEDFDDDILPF